MTRDEAIKIAKNKSYGSNAYTFIDSLIALGVLQVDGPKSVRGKFNAAWFSVLPQCRTIPNILEAIDEAGLKIVDK